MTFRRVFSEIFPCRVRTLETVEMETFAFAATSLMVATMTVLLS
jgi:hypothetical protein